MAKAKRSAKRRSTLPTRKPTRAHLLVIECDAARLAEAGLDVGTKYGEFLQALFPDKRITIIRTSTEAQLGRELADALEHHGHFRSILIVGHSNASGIVLTASGLRPWGIVGKWLKEFKPGFLFLAACNAGKSATVREVFEGVTACAKFMPHRCCWT